MGMMKNFFGDDSLTDDKYVALNMLGSGKASATAYLSATLESATPEIRHLYSNFCTQLTQSHEALTALAIERGWYSAYGEPKSSLEEVVHDSMKIIESHA
ncbi:MAG: spore coat protein [Firmicutes bacterium HGW-Firmicutes-14]|nr:MAG: spore coat protein [Firmicutes bacterium HGW-Firmicutes-14]